jgi:hypothetical protein
MTLGVRAFLRDMRKARLKTYRLYFSVAGRVVAAQIFQAESDEAALAFTELQRRGRDGALRGETGLIASYRRTSASSTEP